MIFWLDFEPSNYQVLFSQVLQSFQRTDLVIKK